MRITKITVKVSVAIIAASLLSACTPKLYYKASGNVDTLKTHIRSDMAKGFKQAQSNSSVIVKNSMYVSNKRIDLQKQPAWLQRPISLHGVQLPFSFYSRSIVRNTGVLTTYQQGLTQNKIVNYIHQAFKYSLQWKVDDQLQSKKINELNLDLKKILQNTNLTKLLNFNYPIKTLFDFYKDDITLETQEILNSVFIEPFPQLFEN